MGSKHSNYAKFREDLLNQKHLSLTITMMDRQTLFFPPPYGTLGCIPIYDGTLITVYDKNDFGKFQTRQFDSRSEKLNTGDRIVFVCCGEIFAEGRILFIEQPNSNLRQDMKQHSQKPKLHWMPVSFRGIEESLKDLHPNVCPKCNKTKSDVVNTFQGVSETIRHVRCESCRQQWVTVEKTVSLKAKVKKGRPKFEPKNETLVPHTLYKNSTRKRS